MCFCGFSGRRFSIGGGGVYAQGAFVHPGLLHSQNDFDQIKKRLAEHDAQTLQAFEVLKNSWVANKAVNDIWGVTEYIKRGIAGDENYMNAYRNAAKAYQCALLWKITGEAQWAERAVYVLNQYVAITKGIGGNTNQSLVPGFIGYQLRKVGERGFRTLQAVDDRRVVHYGTRLSGTSARYCSARR